MVIKFSANVYRGLLAWAIERKDEGPMCKKPKPKKSKINNYSESITVQQTICFFYNEILEL